MTYTNEFIDYLTRFDYMDNSREQENTPAYLDSIRDLEDELAYACESWNEPEVVNIDNIIPFPGTTIDPTDPATSAWAV